MPLWISEITLVNGVGYALDKNVEIGFGLAELLNFSRRVQHSGVMLATERAANLGQGCWRQFFDEVHGDLARIRDGVCVRLLLKLSGLQFELVGDSADHGFHGDTPLIAGNEVLQNLLRHAQADI